MQSGGFKDGFGNSIRSGRAGGGSPDWGDAKQFYVTGDFLVVGLNTDASVRRLKGSGRPLTGEKDRLRVLAALETVDYVTLFPEDTPLALIKKIRPHILVKGADWKEGQIAGAKEVRSWGGRVKRVRLVPGRSTSALVRKIQKG